MFTHLQYQPYAEGGPRLIAGKTLLFLLERVTRAKVGQAAAGAGSGRIDDPWRLSRPDHWLRCASRLTREFGGDAWLTLGGRMIKKDARVYVSDEGPVYRYLQGAGGATPDSSKTYGGVAPTYQVAAQRIVRPGTVFPMTATEGFAGIAEAWTTIGHTRMLVNAMRNLLRGEAMAPLSRHYSRMQASLPVLVAAMFLAEGGRNIRAFTLNLMLLDLAEAGVVLDPIAGTTYSMDRILWHPEALDISSTTVSAAATSPPTTAVTGPVGPHRAMAPVTRRNQLHLVGGEMPASPTMGGERGGVRMEIGDLPDQSHIPMARREKARQGWLRGRLNIQNFDYIHSKEIDVLTRWIAMRRPYTFRAVDAAAIIGRPVEVPDWDVLFEAGGDLANLEDAIATRLVDFDAMT